MKKKKFEIPSNPTLLLPILTRNSPSFSLYTKCCAKHSGIQSLKQKQSKSLCSKSPAKQKHGVKEVRGPEMGTMAAPLLSPSNFNPTPITEEKHALFMHRTRRRPGNTHSIFPVARLLGPAIFEASKLKVVFLGAEKKHPGKYPRTYTLTHSDITSSLTLAISQTINNSQLQGWYNKLQRDEVVAEWKKIKEKMSLHVHCHISGGHFLLDLIARLRYYIFCKELPVVLKAFVHGDGDLLNNYPELQEARVWVYFHSNIPEFNKVECWGPLNGALAPSGGTLKDESGFDTLRPCPEDCSCCFPPTSLIPWPQHARVVDDLTAPSKSLDASQTYGSS